ncbi:MAG: sensor histidine kinase [Planctomycetota bacterium]|nr:MAG: sensor histidine kinase [Planctomycetota bacterium]
MLHLPRPTSLRARLAWYVALPATLWIAGIAWYTGQTLDQELERSLQEDVELVGRAIRAPIARALEGGNLQEVTHTLLSAMDIGRVYGITVYGQDGELIATAGDVDPQGVVQHLEEVADEGRHGAYERLGGRRVYSYFLPLYDQGRRPVGLLQITRRQREMDRTLHSRRLQSLGVAIAGAVGLAVLALWGHHRALSRHLRRLGLDMTRLRHGESQHRAATGGPDEIAALAVALNDMLDSMAQAEAEIAQQRNQQAALRERLAQSEKLAALGHLAAGVAHELGTPLSTIDGHAQRLARDPNQDSSRIHALTRIREEVQRTERIVRQLLEIGRTEQRSRHTISAPRLLRNATAAVSDMIQQRQQQLNVQHGDNNAEISVDPGRVEQALINLMDNASQASPPSSTITLSLDCTPDTITFAVRDCGGGVPDDVRERIFDPFFTTKPVGKGTGLGLAVVHSVAEEHQGSVSLHNHDTGGCSFYLSIPRHETSL